MYKQFLWKSAVSSIIQNLIDYRLRWFSDCYSATKKDFKFK